MALKTLGTNATTSLHALVSNLDQTVADIAQFRENVKSDLEPYPVWPGAFEMNGLLYIPRRGVLQVLPGDYVAYDAAGWPILLSANAIASGSTSWTHS